MTLLIVLWLLISATWTAAMIAAAHLWHRENHRTDARWAIVAACISPAWPLITLTTLTWYALNRKRLP